MFSPLHPPVYQESYYVQNNEFQIDEKDDTTFYMQEAFRRRLRVSH